MRKLTLEQVDDICWIHNYMYGLPDEYKPYFKWWIIEMTNSTIKLPYVQTKESMQWYNVAVKTNDNPMKLNKAQENYLIEASELVDGDLVFPEQDSLTLLMNLNNLAEVEAEVVEEVEAVEAV